MALPREELLAALTAEQRRALAALTVGGADELGRAIASTTCPRCSRGCRW